MARTSRNGAPSANVDALDNIDLDDMFAEDGDALFDGLDIDLDIDDLAGGGDLDTQDKTSVAASRLDVPPPAPAVAAAPASAAATRSRRTTKRKSKAPAFLDDAADEDFVDEPAPTKKKRRKTTKATTAAKKKGARAATAPAAAAVSAAAVGAATVKGTKAKTTKAKTTATKGKAKAKTASTKATKAAPAAMQALPQQLVLGRAGSAPAATISAAAVAAAGRFGGQLQNNKARAASFTSGPGVPKPPRAKLPMATKGKAGRAQSVPGNAAAAAVAANAANLAQLKESHPGLKQGTYCGIQSSNTLFYPFLPSLPPEPTMKTRKIYPVVDRIHTSFQSLLQQPEKMNSSAVTPPREKDPIFQLMQEAYREEKLPPTDDNDNPNSSKAAAAAAAATRVSVVGRAIGTMRETIQKLEVPKLAVDWYAVCALLQRQHDFMKINAENMERWCKEHMKPQDYAAIYLEPDPLEPPSLQSLQQQQQQSQQLLLSKKRKAGDMGKGAASSSILLSFGKKEFRLKVHCTGFQEPKGALPLAVSLPLSLLPESMRPKEKTKKTKKRKTAATSAAADAKTKAAAGGSEKTASSAARSSATTKEQLSYVNMKPARRRKHIADLLARTAGEIEKANLQLLDARRETEYREQSSLHKLVQDDAVPVSHTTGMWKWLELSGYFKQGSESEIRRMLDDVRSPEVLHSANDTTLFGDYNDQKMAALSGSGKSDPTTSNDASIFDRLQSLLVEEDGDNGDEDEDAMEQDDDPEEQVDYEFDCEELYTVAETLDMSKLSLEERSFLHLLSFGLGDELATPPQLPSKPDPKSEKADSSFLLQNGETKASFSSSAAAAAGKNLENVAMNGSSSTTTTERVAHAEFTTSDPSVAVKQQPDSIPSSSLNGGGNADATTTTTKTALPKLSKDDFGPSELDQAISAMTADLVAVNEINNRRASFLQTVSTAYCVSSEEQKLKSDQEASAISRCHALLKKTKEMKAKSGKMASTHDDSLALPW